MSEDRHSDVRMKARAALVDPRSMAVVWMNEAVAQAAGKDDVAAVSLEDIVALTGVPGAADAFREVAATREVRHLRADLVSSAMGSVAVVTAVYPLPGGEILVLVEQAFQPGRGGRGEPEERRGGRGGRRR